jgi:hypothetical protein
MSTLCSQQQFDALKKKAYRNIPRALLTAVIKDLPDYAAVVYLSLYDFAELNTQYPGTVMMSQISLAKHLDKSVRSIGRALQKLKNEGFIEVQEQAKSHYFINTIRVACPVSLAEHIIQEEPNRKNVIPLFPVAPMTVSEKQQTVVQNVSQTAFLKPDAIEADKSVITEHEDPLAFNTLPKTEPTPDVMDWEHLSIDDVEQLYQHYQQGLKKLRGEGVSPFNAAKQAFNPFNAEQVRAIQQHILNQSNLQFDFSTPNPAKMSLGSDKNVRHIRINNNRLKHCYLLTTEQPSVVDNVVPQTLSTTVDPVVNLKKSAVFKDVYQSERVVITKKIRALYKYHEIHPSLRAQYLRPEELIEEVMVHTLYRDFNKTFSSKHALNAAAKMIRAGTWSTPKKLLLWQSLKREQQAAKQKTQEFCALTSSALDEALKQLVQTIRYSSG